MTGLVPGARMGAYEIVSPLGAGGMGAVYRARDTRLGREVAIKVLPPEFANDPERIARFQREAQVLAALNHPHIAQIYGIEDTGDTRALVMELVDGETLDARIARGALPVDEALAIAKQIAEALEAAHEKGIIHRDLKPSNIALTKDGQVKVLDFGLARAMESAPAAAAAGVTHSPTLSLMATQAGMILGTAAYMSPEQAKGQPADHRSDVFSFGCVLYEMLTGKQVFQGETAPEILAAVLMREPEFGLLPASIHPRLREVLQRCLAKIPRQRYHAVADLGADLQVVVGDPLGRLPPPDTRATARRSTGIVLLLVAAGAMIGGAAARLMRSADGITAPETRVDLQLPVTADAGSFALSPDGRTLAFVSAGPGQPELWIRRLSERAPQRLAGTEGAASPFWSPDSRSLAFFTPRFLKRIDLSGGRPENIAPTTFGNGGAWSPRDVIVYNSGFERGFMRVSVTGGPREPVTSEAGQYPHFLPDGRRFLFFVQRAGDSHIAIDSIDERSAQRLVNADSPSAYLASGWLLYLRQDVLFAHQFDLDRGDVRGKPVIVAEGVERFSASPAGTVVYRAPFVARNEFHWFDAAGKDLGAVASGSNPAIAPDGRRLLIDRTADGNRDIWMLQEGRSTRVTVEPAGDMIAVWTADGRHVTFRSVRAGNADIYDRLVDGATGSEHPIVASPLDEMPSDWSRDGRFLLYYTVATDAQRDIYVWSDADHRSVPFRTGAFDEAQAQFSPDGRLIAYMSDESGRHEVYIARFPIDQTRAQWQVSTEGGIWPRWKADGSGLYYISAAGSLMSVAVGRSGDRPTIAAPMTMFRVPLRFDPRTAPQYAVSPNGQFLVRVENQDLPPLTLLLNWAPPK